MLKLLILSFTLIIHFTTLGQTYQWAQKTSYSDKTWGKNIGTDGSGNIYSLSKFDCYSHSSSPTGFMVNKYSSSGTLIWEQKIINSPSNSQPPSFKVDDNGNLYIMTNGTLTIAGQNFNVSYQTSTTLFKMDSDFKLLWFHSFSAWGNDLTIDDKKNVYITGTLNGTATFGSYNFDNTADSSANAGIFVVKYDSLGNCKWARSDGSWLSFGKKIGVDKQGNVTISGTFYGQCIFDTLSLMEANGDNFIAQYDNNGAFKWARQLKDYTFIFSIASDNNSNTYVSGMFGQTAQFGTYTLTSIEKEIFVVKYNTNGNVIWAKSFGGPGYEDGYTSVMAGNELLIAGSFPNAISFGTYYFNVLGMENFYIAKLDTNGTCVWAAKQPEPSSGLTGINCIDTKDGNEIYIAGAFTNELNLGSTAFVSGGTPRGFVSKMKINGGINGISTVNKKDDHFTAYPNPAKNILTIIYKGTAGHLTLKLLNSHGQELYTEVPPPATLNYLKVIDLSKYPKGIYFVQINTGNTSEVRKIVLE